MNFLLYPIIGCFLFYGIFTGALLQIAEERDQQALKIISYSLKELSDLTI